MKKILLLLATVALIQGRVAAQVQEFDMTQPQPVYSDDKGYGYDFIDAPDGKTMKPFYFSVKVPDGNYLVTVTLGAKKKAGSTVVRGEGRRLFVELAETKKGEFRDYQFVVNKRSPKINDKLNVSIKEKEKSYLNWDDRLTLEFNGAAPAVKTIKIEPVKNVQTVFLCGNSTVVDQDNEPYASWGQMIPRWFGPEVAISNHAESGLSAKTFLAGKRLDKILSMMQKDDYVFVEFGHNDQKEKYAGDGAWYSFVHNLKIFIDRVREKGGHIVFVTPTQRRMFNDDKKTIRETHGDFPEAMRYVAKREDVPVIELHDMTRDLFETLGYEDSKRSLVHYPLGSFPNQKKELADNTHFNPYGAYQVAKMVVMGMKQLNLPMVKYLRSDFKDYDPKHPDDWKKFVWFPSAKSDLTKPDGN